VGVTVRIRSGLPSGIDVASLSIVRAIVE